MECNIDNRGVAFRRRMGYLLVAIGMLLAAAAYWFVIWWLWVLAALVVAGGVFCLFEARHKWCAIRAMGIETKI